MDTRRGRSIEVDFFRGVVLIVIVLDHIPGSTLSHLMLHAYALCDSAEVFVFLGGYASAAAYTAVLAGPGRGGAGEPVLRGRPGGLPPPSSPPPFSAGVRRPAPPLFP